MGVAVYYATAVMVMRVTVMLRMRVMGMSVRHTADPDDKPQRVASSDTVSATGSHVVSNDLHVPSPVGRGR